MANFGKCLAGVMLALAVGGGACAAQPIVFTRMARVALDANGKVVSVVFDEAKPGFVKLDAKLEPLVRGWSFAPGKIDGKPVPTETSLGFLLQATPAGKGDYAISVLNAWPGVSASGNSPPMYPVHALEQACEAVISLDVTVDSSGSPTDVQVASSDADCAKKTFETAAIAAARKWRFTMEVVGGHAVGAKLRMPVDFCLGAGFAPGRHGTCARHAAQRDRASDDISIDSQAKLLTQVAGTAIQGAGSP